MIKNVGIVMIVALLCSCSGAGLKTNTFGLGMGLGPCLASELPGIWILNDPQAPNHFLLLHPANASAVLGRAVYFVSAKPVSIAQLDKAALEPVVALREKKAGVVEGVKQVLNIKTPLVTARYLGVGESTMFGYRYDDLLNQLIYSDVAGNGVGASASCRMSEKMGRKYMLLDGRMHFKKLGDYGVAQ